MGDPSDNQRAPSKKVPRAEPNLELPSFRIKRKKTEPKDAPAAEVIARVEVIKEAPNPAAPNPRKAPPRPPAAATAARPVPPPPPPSRKLPPAPPPPTIKAATELTQEPKQDPEPRAAKGTQEPKPAREPKPPREAKTPKPQREGALLPLPHVPGWFGAVFTGAFCGALTVLLAWATSQGCAAVRGVGTCGSFGLVALVAILGIDVVLASALLRGFRIIDPTTTSLLGVGLVAVFAMLFFLSDTQSVAMVYVIPVLMAATFTGAWWLTNAIAQRVDDDAP